jgi:hypothetical protein
VIICFDAEYNPRFYVWMPLETCSRIHICSKTPKLSNALFHQQQKDGSSDVICVSKLGNIELGQLWEGWLLDLSPFFSVGHFLVNQDQTVLG